MSDYMQDAAYCAHRLERSLGDFPDDVTIALHRDCIQQTASSLRALLAHIERGRVPEDSRGMFVARLRNMRENGGNTLSVDDVLGLLNDCDMLATRSLLAAAPAAPDCPNCFEGKSDMDHVCRECGGTGVAPAAPDHSATVPAEVPMPEPAATMPIYDRVGDLRLIPNGEDFTREQMQQYGDAREAAGYAQAKEVVRAGLSSAAVDVLAERQRQISVEGWTLEHDDKAWNGQFARAASAYAKHAGLFLETGKPSASCPQEWPWSGQWWKPTVPRRDLVKAGALILAEIERLDRAARKGGA